MDIPLLGVLFMTLFYLCARSVDTYTLYNVTALRRHLFETQKYDKLSRPMMDQSQPTQVSIKFNIYTIYDVEEVTQTLKVAGSLHMEWLDEALVWDPVDFGGINVGVYPQDHVWKPGVALKNSVESFETVGDPTLHVVVNQNGTVMWDPYQVNTVVFILQFRIHKFKTSDIDDLVLRTFVAVTQFLYSDTLLI